MTAVLDFSSKLAAAYFLDLIFGDPQWFPHPVRLIGILIEKGEKFFRRLIRSEVVSGAALSLGLTAAIFFLSYWVLKCLSFYARPLSAAAEILILYFCLATKDLAVQSRAVKSALESKDMDLARKKLSWIVGRDTDRLDESGIVRATVETVAENTVDGIVAPLFYAAVGGAPLALAYKTVNTLDSMIGHKDERYIRFGKVAAKIDTWVNWLPARISGVLFPLTAALLNFSAGSALKTGIEGAKSGVPNSGIPEGAMAGALQIQLGGTNYYGGRVVETAKLGNAVRPISVQNIEEAIKLMVWSSFLFFVICLALRVWVGRHF